MSTYKDFVNHPFLSYLNPAFMSTAVALNRRYIKDRDSPPEKRQVDTQDN